MALAPIPEINDITSQVIKAAIEVHRCLGPGLFESVYLAAWFKNFGHPGSVWKHSGRCRLAIKM